MRGGGTAATVNLQLCSEYAYHLLSRSQAAAANLQLCRERAYRLLSSRELCCERSPPLALALSGALISLSVRVRQGSCCREPRAPLHSLGRPVHMPDALAVLPIVGRASSFTWLR